MLISLLVFACLNNSQSVLLSDAAPIGRVAFAGDTLQVFGTDARNVIRVSAAEAGLRVVVDGFDHGTFAVPAAELQVYGKAGNDAIKLDPSLTLVTRLCVVHCWFFLRSLV